MTDPAAPTTPEPFNFVRDTDGVLVQDDRHKIGHWLPAWAYHALRSKWQSEAEAGSRLGSTTPAEAECNHPPSMLTTSTYNGPDGRMVGVEQRCECGASWGSTTPAEALDVSPEELRSRAKDIRDEFRADEAASGLDAALAHIALALAQAEARLPFEPETERIVRQTLAIVDQTTPLSVGEPLVQLILARLHESDR